MATHHGNEGSAAVGANTIAEVTAWSYSESYEPAEDTALGDTAKTYKTGGAKDGSGSVTCHLDDTDTNGQEAMTVGSEITLNLYFEGETAGDAYFTGDVIITSMEVGLEMAGVVSRSFNFVGVLTYTTVGA